MQLGVGGPEVYFKERVRVRWREQVPRGHGSLGQLVVDRQKPSFPKGRRVVQAYVHGCSSREHVVASSLLWSGFYFHILQRTNTLTETFISSGLGSSSWPLCSTSRVPRDIPWGRRLHALQSDALFADVLPFDQKLCNIYWLEL